MAGPGCVLAVAVPCLRPQRINASTGLAACLRSAGCGAALKTSSIASVTLAHMLSASHRRLLPVTRSIALLTAGAAAVTDACLHGRT